MKNIEEYINFFDLQRRDQEEEFKQYAKTALSTLFSSGSAFWGEIKGISANGNLILHFSSPFCPRLKVPMNICILKSCCEQELGNDFSKWDIESLPFRCNMDFHSSFSDAVPIYFLKNSKDTIGFERVDLRMCQSIQNALFNRKSLKFVMLETLPPTELLRNLGIYVKEKSSDKDLILNYKRTYDEWNPIELESKDDVDVQIMSALKNNDIALLQGPPGTGKSYTIANIISKWTEGEKRICVTTQSNSSLISLLAQKPLKEYIKEGKVSKTNLSSEESHKIPTLKIANKDLTISSGELLCSTYYTLSRIINEVNTPIYDLIIIEEASQAYSAAIAAFKKLGKKCLIVGDPMQLPPIVKILRPNNYEGIDIDKQTNGMMSIIRSMDIPSYRMTTSFRLTPKSAMQTSIFYHEHLTSIATSENEIICDDIRLKQFFPNEGGTLLYETSGSSSAELSEEAFSLIKNIEMFFYEKYPKKKLAILSPYVKTTKRLQQHFCGDQQALDVTVDTINRIQGLTVDYTIFYVPTRNFEFAFSENLFNVATSRSSTSTLLITDFPLSMLPIKSEKVRKFLMGCKILNSNYGNQKIVNAHVDNVSSLKIVGFIDPSSFERKKKELSETKENLYIIDTNVFVDCPEIISKIDKQYPVVLSAKVTDELDKMKIKLDEHKRKNAEKALRLLNIENTHKIIYELADTSLLPDDFEKKSPDNMILSVALKYRSENPIILTSDNGLQLKSKILGISTISLKTFLKR